MEDVRRDPATPEPASFLQVLNKRLGDSKQILYGVSERLNERGFYGPPSDIAKGTSAATPENNLRHQLDEVAERIYETALLLREQIDRLA